MPSRLPEIWQARERVREQPPTDEMRIAFVEILTAFRQISRWNSLSEYFNISFNDDRLSRIGNQLVQPQTTSQQSIYNIGIKSDASSIHHRVYFLLKNDDQQSEHLWILGTNEENDFVLSKENSLESSRLIEMAAVLKNLLNREPHYRRDRSLQRAFNQFDQAVYRLDHEGDAELIEELVRLAGIFSEKVKGLMDQIDSLKKGGREIKAHLESVLEWNDVDELLLLEEAHDELTGSPSSGKNGFLEGFRDFFRRRKNTILSPAKNLWDRAVRWKKPLLLGGGLAVVGAGIDQTILDAMEVREGAKEREAVQMFVQKGDPKDDSLISVYSPDSHFFTNGGGYSIGYDTSIPLTQDDIQEGGNFYYGAEAMRVLEGDFLLSEQACGAFRDTAYHYSPNQFSKRLDDMACGLGLSNPEAILLNSNHRRLSQGAFGIKNFVWIYWGFDQGIQDERMTIGHQLVLASLLRYPWFSNDSVMVKLNEEGSILRRVNMLGWVTLADSEGRKWLDTSDGHIFEVDIYEDDWDNFQDHRWTQIQARAEIALDLLIEDGVITDLQRSDILTQIDGARPKSWRDLINADSDVVSYSLETDYLSNPGGGLSSIFQSPIQEAIRELGYYEFRDSWNPPYTYADLRDEVASVTLTIDPDMQAKVMEIVREIDPNSSKESRLIVLNDHGEILALFDGASLDTTEPFIKEWVPFNYSKHRWRVFSSLDKEDLFFSCYNSGNILNDWLSLLSDIRTGIPMPRLHIVSSYHLQNGEIIDFSHSYNSSQATCASNVKSNIVPFGSIKQLEDGVFHSLISSANDKWPDDEDFIRFDTAWIRFVDGSAYIVVASIADKEILASRLLHGIHDVWLERNPQPD